MGYRTLRACLDDLAASGQLLRIEQEIDPHLEAAEIHRRVYAAGGPALYFARVKGSPFPMVSNLFGTLARARYLFRDTLARVEQLVRLKIDPAEAARRPWRVLPLLRTLWHMRPKPVRTAPLMARETRLELLPRLQSWPDDGGPFITLPIVYSEDVSQPGIGKSNLGMYRVQLAGNEYRPNREVGLHYQIHRGIGVHHAAALRTGRPFRVHVHVGGPPALTLAAVMPLPEGLSEVLFAGALGGRRVPYAVADDGLSLLAECDFCLTGTVDPERLLPEGPFGDHLGYYSLKHPFPVLRVDHVYHRPDAVWPFTVVGRPPQEDTAFGQLIHEITGPVIPAVVPGVKAVHAVDASGVHPLLLAVGSERYTPYQPTTAPQELLTQACAILGQGQMSLAKYLLIVSSQDDPDLEPHEIERFLRRLLERIDWTRDLHFHTRTTIDTLDYSGSGLNQGSKVVLAAAGPVRRALPTVCPTGLTLPAGWSDPQVCLPGVLAVQGSRYDRPGDDAVERFCRETPLDHPLNGFPLVVAVDDSRFTAATLRNFLWVTFTRSNPAADLHGVGPFVEQKHWGCRGSLVIDARAKPHHAPPLVEDPEITRRVDRLAAAGGPLHGVLP